MKVILLVCIALLDLGCSDRADCNGVYTASDQFDAAEWAKMKSAASRWAAFAGRPVSISLGTGNTCHIAPVAQITDIDPGQTVGGENYAHTGNIAVSESGRDPQRFEQVVLHEMGHGFGLQHIADPNAVMHIIAGVDFNEADREECRAVGACTN